LPPVITDPATLERVAAVLRLAVSDEPLVPSQRKRSKKADTDPWVLSTTKPAD
jgi:hypothetical protein